MGLQEAIGAFADYHSKVSDCVFWVGGNSMWVEYIVSYDDRI
jgi:hypothetical protein